MMRFTATNPASLNVNDCESSSSMIETLRAMRRQEEIAYSCHDYLQHHYQQQQQIAPRNCSLDEMVDVECRFQMSKWCYQIVDHCKFNRETVAITMSCLDRFLASSAGQEILNDRSLFQLATMTCFYTAVKIHEPEAMTPAVVASLSRGAYSKEQVEEMELVILKAIKWLVNPPTALSFIRNFLEILPAHILTPEQRAAVADLALFQAELAVSDYAFVTVNASIVAFATIMNALESIGLDEYTCDQLECWFAEIAQLQSLQYNIQEIRIRLYEAVTKQPGNEACLQKKTSNTSFNDTHCGNEQDIYASPRTTISAIQ